jgi:NinB protein
MPSQKRGDILTHPSTFYLVNDKVRVNCIAAIHDLPDGYRVSMAEPRRTTAQSDRMWAMLTEFSKQATLNGQAYDKEDWKLIFMHALGRELRMAPALAGNGFVPIGTSSSKLSGRDMSDLIELIYAEGAARGVVFKEPDQGREAR